MVPQQLDEQLLAELSAQVPEEHLQCDHPKGRGLEDMPVWVIAVLLLGSASAEVLLLMAL